MEMDRYSINDLSMITGLTTRTIRNYLNLGVMKGEKIDGNWSFTEEDVEEMMKNDYVKQAMSTKRNAIVYDFMADMKKKDSRMCVILDLAEDAKGSMEVSRTFCDFINENSNDIRFNMFSEGGNIRVILSGDEKEVLKIMRHYYS